VTTSGRRPDLSAFLRSRRERTTPEQVGMPPGARRRTPGLRREEVAQLAGVGVTWYTWLEQGRPINASAHVLDAIARTLRLDAAERDHLHRLAELPPPAADAEVPTDVPDDLDAILSALDPLPAMVVNARTDILRWNQAYAVLHPGLISAPADERNTVWNLFTVSPARNHIINRDEQAPEVVAALRYRYSQNRNEPQWQGFVARLCTTSPLFARLWATHDVATPRLCDKRYDIPAVGEVTLRSTGMDLTNRPGLRLVVHTPADEHSRQHIDQIGARGDSYSGEH
jgi:transcriptional regulator with XRE-family HTH domain